MEKQVADIDLNSYVKQRDAGAIKIVKLHGLPHFGGRRFDETTGKPIPVAKPISEDQVKATIAGITADIAAMNAALEGAQALLADVQNAPEVIDVAK